MITHTQCPVLWDSRISTCMLCYEKYKILSLYILEYHSISCYFLNTIDIMDRNTFELKDYILILYLAYCQFPYHSLYSVFGLWTLGSMKLYAGRITLATYNNSTFSGITIFLFLINMKVQDGLINLNYLVIVEVCIELEIHVSEFKTIC